jgi:dTDP-4-dehydrorhamnose 3,5-epimerase
MPLKVIKTNIPDVVVFEPVVFKDSRGFFMESYNQKKYKELGLKRTFVQDNFSHSSKGTLRGLHYQLNYPQAKFVFVVHGEVFDVAVDIRRGSPTFGHWVGELLSSENNRQIFIPEGFAHGFCVLSEAAVFMYKCTDFYHPEDDRGLNFSDETIGINWPIKAPILSDKDSALPMLHDLPEKLLPVYEK